MLCTTMEVVFVKSLLLNLQFFLTSSLLENDGVLTKTKFLFDFTQKNITAGKKIIKKKLLLNRSALFIL